MIPKGCKRLAEVDFPIAVVSKHAAREKSIRHGHPSTLHLWWARRPLAACRAMLLALLLPDPCDENCPRDFKETARRLLERVPGRVGSSAEDLRKALLNFIGDFANWGLSSDATYLQVSRGLVKAAHGEEPPLVVDPFAGGGSIPLEALRLGCDTFASDLNPVACLILKVMLQDISRQGPALAEELRQFGAKIKRQAEEELADLYPKDPDGATPIAYLWARTVRCESPNCGAEIPLARSFWLCKKANRRRALRPRVERSKGGPPTVEFEIFDPRSESGVSTGTVSRAKAACLACHTVLPPERVRAQLATQHGGADVVFDGRGKRTGGARLLAVVTLRPGETGRHYRLPAEPDYEAVRKAQQRVAQMLEAWERGGKQGPCPVPDEPTPAGGGSGAGRAFSVHKYGMSRWGDLFTARQALALVTISRAIVPFGRPIALALGKLADLSNAICRWEPVAECPRNVLAAGRVKPAWDFAEGVPISNASGSWAICVENLAVGVASVGTLPRAAACQIADARDHPLPEAAADLWFTDPPYDDQIPYADLSDFFFVWLKRGLPGDDMLRDPFDARNPLTPKQNEIVRDETKIINGRSKDRAFFEAAMADAFAAGRRVLREDGISSVVFAHQTTEGWEALLSGMIRGGWTITASWPIATELGHRIRAQQSAALATSVHLVCRPREKERVEDWAEVLRELPQKVEVWMERLQTEGVRGADLVFACIGPALEIYSRYSKVVDAEEREIPLGGDPEAKEPHKRGYLAYVWEVVGRTALEQVLGIAEARAGTGAAGGLEEDARLTSLFLWTLQSTNGAKEEKAADAEDEESDEAEGNDESKPAKKKPGFSLIYDVVRRFAQPLGIHLKDWEDRIIETDKGVVRLLPVAERAKQLFGDDGADAMADHLEANPTATPQLALFSDADSARPKVKGRGRRKAGPGAPDAAFETRREATTLDSVHAAMLLQRAGRANALRGLLSAEQDRGPDFLRLANALSALYPRESEEKRLLDAMLLAVPR